VGSTRANLNAVQQTMIKMTAILESAICSNPAYSQFAPVARLPATVNVKVKTSIRTPQSAIFQTDGCPLKPFRKSSTVQQHFSFKTSIPTTQL
jgi:hypothetical protein